MLNQHLEIYRSLRLPQLIPLEQRAAQKSRPYCGLCCMAYNRPMASIRLMVSCCVHRERYPGNRTEGQWYANDRNPWKSGSAFAAAVHHQSLLQRRPLCIPINPARPQAWRGFSLLFADLAPTLGGHFRAVSPHFPLSFSAPCGRAKPKVRKAKSLKISDLGNTPNPEIFPRTGGRIKIRERESHLKSAQPYAFSPHGPSPPPHRSAGVARPNTGACRLPGRTTRLPRARFHSESRPGYRGANVVRLIMRLTNRG